MKNNLIMNLLTEIEKYSNKYQFSFQFWGLNNNNVYICKDDVELYSSGGFASPNGAIVAALLYIYKINRVKKENRIC